MSKFYKLISAEDLINMKLESIPCLIEPIFPNVGLVAIGGGSDTGKSTLIRQLCVSIVTGADHFMGYKINAEHKRVMYVSTEDEERATAYLLGKQNNNSQLPGCSFENLHYLFDPSDLITAIETNLKIESFDLVVIDAFADVYGKDINQSNQVRSFLTEFYALSVRYKCLFLFIHHTGKASESKAPSKNSMLGSQGFESRMRTLVMLKKHNTNPHLRYLCVVKGNYIPEHLKNEATELLFDDDMTFSLTGRTELIENLSKDEGHKYKEEQVLKLHGQGKSQGAIAKEVGISQSTVCRIIGAGNS